MIEEIKLEIFLFNPTESLLKLIDNKELALDLLEKFDSSKAKLFLWQKDRITIDILLNSLIKDGDRESFFTIVLNNNVSKSILKKIASYAARYGRKAELYYLIGTNNYGRTNVATNAAEGGHKGIVYDMIERGPVNFYSIVRGAALGGNSELFFELVDKCSINTAFITRDVAIGGSMEIIEYLIEEKNVTDYDLIACCAVEKGHIDVVRSMLERGCTCYNNIAFEAAWYGQDSILTDMIKLAGSKCDYNQIARGAAIGGNLKVIINMISKGITIYNEIALIAAQNGHTDIVIEMLKMGATNHKELITNAKDYGFAKTSHTVEKWISKSTEY